MGVGKPHNPDERVQDYLLANIYKDQHNATRADSYYLKILTYSNQIKGNGNHRFNFQNLITLLVYEHYGKEQKAETIRKEIIQSLGHKKTIKAWLKAQGNNQKNKMQSLRETLLKKVNFQIPSWFKVFLQLKRNDIL